jgi:hypothetical protein
MAAKTKQELLEMRLLITTSRVVFLKQVGEVLLELGQKALAFADAIGEVAPNEAMEAMRTLADEEFRKRL